MPKLTVYDFGKNGLNLNSSPLHKQDGDLRTAQNVIYDSNGEEGGLSKRPGMDQYADLSAGGEVAGFIDVPIAQDAVKWLFAARNTSSSASNTWIRTTDGATWYNETRLEAAQQDDKISSLTANLCELSAGQRCVAWQGKLIYPGNSYVCSPTASNTPPEIRIFDGVNDEALISIPPHPNQTAGDNSAVITGIYAHRNQVFVLTADDADSTRGRVFLLDPLDGTLEQVGEAFGTDTGLKTGGVPWSFTGFGSFILVGTHQIAGGAQAKIYRIRPGVDTTWTLEHTFAAGQGHVTSLAVYNGKAYCTIVGEAAKKAGCYVRSSAAAWTVSEEMAAGAPIGYDYYDGLVVYDDDLYCVKFIRDASQTFQVRKFDGASWSTAYDIQANYAARATVGQPVVYKNKLYLPIPQPGTLSNGLILKNDAGTWSKATDYAGRGFMAIVTMPAGVGGGSTLSGFSSGFDAGAFD